MTSEIARPERGSGMADRGSWFVAKRLIDVVIGIPLAALAIPVILACAAGVGLALRQWPFFVQRRVGHYGREILFPKLRTLPKETPPYASKHEIEVPTSGFLAWLRRRHLDELPQLVVVPLGWLSLVGPRPKMPDNFEPVPEVYRSERVLVPQGCTGLWQISTHSEGLPHDTPQYDMLYLRAASIKLDLWILWKTALLFFGLTRPIDIDQVPSWEPHEAPTIGTVELLEDAS